MIKYSYMISYYILKIMLDGFLYSLLINELYKEKFALFINDGIIDIVSLSDEELYSNINNLFGWVANLMCIQDEVDILQRNFVSLREFDKVVM